MRKDTETQVGQKWLLGAGILFTLLGLAYFLKYSFDQNWIGPWARVAMAYGASFSFFLIGETTRGRGHAKFGAALLGLGVATCYLSTYGAHALYGFFDTSLVFLILGLVTLYSGILALRCDSQELALVGTIGGFAAPILLRSILDDPWAFLSYLSTLNLGILALALYRQWRGLNILGALLTWFLFSRWMFFSYQEDFLFPALLFANLFFTAYELVPFAFYFTKESRKPIAGYFITLPNTLLSFGYSYSLIHGPFSLKAVAIVAGAYSAIFFWLAATLREHKPENLEAFILLLAKGIFFALLLPPLLFSGNWTTLCWAFQALLLLWANRVLPQARLFNSGLILFGFASLKFLFYDYPDVFGLSFGDPYFHFRGGWVDHLSARFATWGALLLSGGLAASWISEKARSGAWTAWSLFLFVTLNLETQAFFQDQVPQAVFACVSILWALFASGLMALGFLKPDASCRTLSLFLFTATLLKVFFSDLSHAGTPFRIASTIVLGLLLIGASYLYHRFSERLAVVPSKGANHV